VLAGVRPEEVGEWSSDSVEPVQALTLATSAEIRDQAVASVIDQARRLAGRGSDAVVLLDTLEGLHPHAARRALAAARKIVDGGSVTVIATATEPLGGETTVIALDRKLAAIGQFPALDVFNSGTIRAERLVGDEGVAEIARARVGAGGGHAPDSGQASIHQG
jgi:transcription termination factor Rho